MGYFHKWILEIKTDNFTYKNIQAHILLLLAVQSIANA